MSGIPVLGMLDGEGANVIRMADAGLACDAGDSAGLADAVQHLASMSREERLAMGARGRAFAEHEFDRRMLMDKLESFLTEAVQRLRGVKSDK